MHGFRIIPDRGSWIEVQFDTSDLLYVYLDRRKRRRKFFATTFLRALGYPSFDEDIIKLFYEIIELNLSEFSMRRKISTKVLFEDIRDGEITVARAFEPLNAATTANSCHWVTRACGWWTPSRTIRSSSPLRRIPPTMRRRL